MVDEEMKKEEQKNVLDESKSDLDDVPQPVKEEPVPSKEESKPVAVASKAEKAANSTDAPNKKEEKDAELNDPNLKPIKDMDYVKSLLSDEILTNYKLIRKIGEGGMNSLVYLAENKRYKALSANNDEEKYVALKIVKKDKNISDEDWKRFNDECITSIRVNDIPNVIHTYHIYKNSSSNAIIIVMQYMNGLALREIIGHEGHLSIQESLFIFKKIMIALKGLHSFKQKIIHRDLKPENILLSQDRSEVKIIDFGISSVVLTTLNNRTKNVITNESNLYGTYPYISPDLLGTLTTKSFDEKIAFITPQCDFFAAGVILYEMLVGDKPFIAEDYDDPEIIKLPLKYDLPPLHRNNPKIPICVENIIFRCIATKKEDRGCRYEDAEEIINDTNYALKHLDAPNEGTLIKPYESRVLQNDAFTFNIDKEKQKLKFYQTKWFFWCVTLVFAILIILAVILLAVNLS